MQSDAKEKLELTTQEETEQNLKAIQDNAERERLKNWQEKEAKNRTNYTYSIERKSETNKAEISIQFKDESLPGKQQYETMASTLHATTGSSSPHYASLFLSQTINTFTTAKTTEKEMETIVQATSDALLSLNPKDEIEGMLCAKILVLQDQTMNYTMRAQSSTDPKIIDSNVNRAVKLGRLQNETIQTLLKYRRKGDQSVVVQHQHINVASGGQAIGVHTTGGAGDNKKN